MPIELMSVLPEVPQERAGAASEYHEHIFPFKPSSNEWLDLQTAIELIQARAQTHNAGIIL